MSKDFEINVLTKDLIHALNFAGGIVEKRNVRPILGNVKLTAKDDHLLITATSNDISLQITIGATVKSEGETTVNILTLLEIVRKLSDNTISIIFNHKVEQLEVKGESFTSHLATLPASDFPVLDNTTDDISFKVSAKSLLRLIIHSEFAMSTEETRYNLNGIFINSSKPNKLTATAIDGHRLATITDDIEINSNLGLILPKRIVFELIKILKDSRYSELDIDVKCNSNKIAFAIDNLHIISKLIDATFPDYQSFIPTENKNKLLIHSKLLAQVVDRVATVTHDKFRAIKIAISKDLVEVSAFGETKGTAKEILFNTDNDKKFLYEGEAITIGFNPKYLLDILKNMEDQEIEVLLASSVDPILLKPITYENDQHIIMPMKV